MKGSGQRKSSAPSLLAGRFRAMVSYAPRERAVVLPSIGDSAVGSVGGHADA